VDKRREEKRREEKEKERESKRPKDQIKIIGGQ